MNEPSITTRRDFIKTSGSAMLGGALVSSLAFPALVGAAPPGDRLKIGWIGCGGRGTGAAAQALEGDSNVELWSVGDVFRDKIDSSLESLKTQFREKPDKINVAEERKFSGLDAYQKVIDSGVDVVLLATPPGFRPQHIKAAVEAGKHIFAEKPMAVDAPGLRSVMASVQLAKEKKLSLVDGFVWRFTKANREVYQRIHDGEIGDITVIYSSYYTGSVDRYPKWNRQNTPRDLEWQLRRWYYFNWLSGDHIVEQAVHSIDKMLWAMKDEPPARCVASGGRQTRPGPAGGDYGNIFDHFSAEYHWADGTRGYHFCRQSDRCHNENSDAIFGMKGVYQGESGAKRHAFTKCATPWRYKAAPGESDNGYQTEHNELFASIRAGQPINTGDRSCKTTLAAIMARMSAYTGQEITWEMALNSKEELFPKNITWEMALPVAPMPIPGATPFV